MSSSMKSAPADFYAAKGIVESILEKLGQKAMM